MGTQEIVVTGDAALACVMYPSSLKSTIGSLQRGKSDYFQSVVLPRGASLLCKMLDCMDLPRRTKIYEPTKVPAMNNVNPSVSTYLDVEENDDEDEGSAPTAFRVKRYQQLQSPSSFCIPPVRNVCRPSIFVVEDSVTGFDNVTAGLSFFRSCKPQLVIYHMKLPLATGELWECLRHGAYNEEGVQDADRIIVVIDSDDLKYEGVELNQYLSWERMCEDLVRYFGSNARLETLATCAHVLVRCGNSGVIHHQGRSVSAPCLIVDPILNVTLSTESDSRKWKEHATAFMAGLVFGQANDPSPDLQASIKLGIETAQAFARMGLNATHPNGAPGYPTWKSLKNLVSGSSLAVASVPAARIMSGGNRSTLEGATWSILEDSTGSLHDLARKVVLEGLRRALSHIPVCQYSNLVLVDRTAIENFGAMDETINRYLDTKSTTPLGLAIFGTQGSGKTFAMTEFAKTTAKGRSREILTFRLSQICGSDQLHAAVEEINHVTHSGRLPIVLWGDFDTDLPKEPGLVRLLVSYLNHGFCHSKSGKRSCGSGIWFFVSERYGSLAEFSRVTLNPGTTLTSTFLGSLQGHMDFRGPNQATEIDGTYVVRRACLLRALLEKRDPGITTLNRFRIEDTVLDALLSVPTYNYGAKSLAAIVAGSDYSALTGLQRSSLPTESLLSLHVDLTLFMALVRSPGLTPELRETIAHGLFEAYKAERRLMAESDGNEESVASDPSMCEWIDLKPELKESTRSQADDIPHKLRAINCYMTKKDKGTSNLVEFPSAELEQLSELEHERFNSERLQRHWRIGARDSKSRTTPFLVPWRDLEQKWRDVDSAMVKCVPEILLKAGFKIYRLD